MSKTLKLEIKETAEELRDLLKKETNAQIKEKLHALYLLKSGLVTTLEGLSEFLVRDRATIYRWFEKYKKSGLTGLLKLYKPAGRSLSIPPGRTHLNLYQATLWYSRIDTRTEK